MIRSCLALLSAGLAGAWAPAGAAEPAPDVTTTLWVPDGSVLYVRYGEPGGVRVRSLFLSGNAQPDSAAPAAAGSGTSPPATDLATLIRSLMRDELARYSTAPGAAAPGVVATGPAPSTAGRDSGGLLDAEVGRGLTTSGGERDVPAPRTTVIDERGGTPSVVVREPVRAPGQAVPPAGDREPLAGVPAPLPSPEIIREQILDDGLFRTNLVLFETSRDALLPHSQEVLAIVGQVLREFPQARVRIEGHADPRGPEDFNLALSQRRANAVRDYLMDCCGLGPEQLEARGYGESRPLVTGDNPTALALNRRVEFRILNPEALRR